MACGGFNCLRISLFVLNIVYMVVSLLLIGMVAWGKWFGLVSSFQVVGAIAGVGVFLFFVATLGLYGTLKHHQVYLFFYMAILFIIFIIQLSVSCACLAINKEQQKLLLEIGWNKSDSMQKDLERTLNCCDFSEINYNETCEAVCFEMQQCDPCSGIIQSYAGEALRFVGGTSLFFSFTEVLSVWLTYRYRNQKDPRLNTRTRR